MPDSISVVFVTYNRADLLERTFLSMRTAIGAIGLAAEYIVSDDASDLSHQDIIARLPFDKKLIADRNQGLGANANKGVASASNEYILQVQDDCEFVGDPSRLHDALRILEEDPRVGIVQLVSSMEAAVEEECACPNKPSVRYVLFSNDQMDRVRDSGLRPYSDQPHIKRRQFCNDIGTYREGVRMTTMELDYQRRVANQNRWYVATFVDRNALFQHLGADRTFNPSVLRARRIEKVESIPVVGKALRHVRRLGRETRNSLRKRFST